jgi:hypothetical protein
VVLREYVVGCIYIAQGSGGPRLRRLRRRIGGLSFRERRAAKGREKDENKISRNNKDQMAQTLSPGGLVESKITTGEERDAAWLG